MSTRLSGRFLTIDVPLERDLAPGPCGRLVQVVDYDAPHGVWYTPVDLNAPTVLVQQGLRPSEADPRTHQQVVYAVAMSVLERFEKFSGFRFRWQGDDKLRIVPHAFEGRNAYFDKRLRAVLFGYYRADERDPGANLPGQMMFTCLSVDVVAHEVTHAIIQRIREYFSEPTHPDVLAFHETFADLVALFHHFTFREVVAEAVATSRGDLETGSALLDLASEFGVSTGRGAALRSAIGSERTPDAFLHATEPHERGACFVAAVFDAFLDTYRGRIGDLRRLASNGTGVLPEGALPPDLVDRVTSEAVSNADRILGMVIRGLQYLPVVDVTFGDVVRAIVTADQGLYPDDAMHLRATLIESFRRRGIYPPGVSSLADDALLWERPRSPLRLTGDAANVDLAPLILEATLDLDVKGTASFDQPHDAPTDDPPTNDTPPDDAPPRTKSATRGRAYLARFQEWGVLHAYELGLDAAHKIELVGARIVYQRGADDQPRPIVVLQYAQRRDDLEDQTLTAKGTQIPREKRAAIRASATVIARVDGEVRYLVTKPLPITDSPLLQAQPDPVRALAAAYDQRGRRRLDAIRSWFGDVEDRDPLASWVDGDAALRLDLARLHAEAAT
ncbi:hypothetical protein [Microbacterium sp. bgisy203]|uniref:hypothetical protein n=1 Tax=Microbacterium sp. bgisy203 TaxID=3413799 RepID=UPI003D70E59C